MSRVCRLCLAKLQKASKYVMINAVEPSTGFMPFRDQLTSCIPEIALDLVPNPLICNNCRTALKVAYDFKTRCLGVETRIRRYVENAPSGQPDLANISAFEATLATDPNATVIEVPEELNKPEFVGLNVKQEKAEVNNFAEDMNISSVGQTGMNVGSDVNNESMDNELYTVTEVKSKTYVCETCFAEFLGPRQLTVHNMEVHALNFTCNFCSNPFTTLQNLRKHNSVCMMKKRPSTGINTVVPKRPHLPTIAKNRLKKWLFAHTDHPYPTDHEKQLLMKETDLSLLQVENWFINARRRILQDMTRIKNSRISDYEQYLELHSDIDLGAIGPSTFQAVSPPPPVQIKQEIEDR